MLSAAPEDPSLNPQVTGGNDQQNPVVGTGAGSDSNNEVTRDDTVISNNGVTRDDGDVVINVGPGITIEDVGNLADDTDETTTVGQEERQAWIPASS